MNASGHLRRRAVVAVGVASAAALMTIGGGAVATGAPRHQLRSGVTHRSAVPLRSAKAGRATAGDFNGVAAVPHSSDLWAIGGTPTKYVGVTRPFAARRHNGRWQRFSGLNVGAADAGGGLSTVAVGSKSAVWVGGDVQYKKTIQDLPAIWRLKGKRFVRAKLPNMENGVASITSISASSARNAWAVGGAYVLPAGTLAAFHWNGKTWSTVPMPEPSFDQTPVSVSTSSTTNAWATDGSNLFHWNGKLWTTDGTAAAGVQLSSVATSGPKLAYAVGFLSKSTGGYSTVIMRFNGTSWTTLKLAKGTAGDSLRQVSIVGKSAWAVGTYNNVKADTSSPAMLHTTGGQWKSQKTEGAKYILSSVSAASAKRAYAVGTYLHGTTYRVAYTFLDVYNGHSWKSAPSKL